MQNFLETRFAAKCRFCENFASSPQSLIFNMRKQVFGRKFKRDKNQRKALFSGLISAMILNGKIKTTEEKAKAIRGELEKLVTKAKKGESSKRLLAPYLKPFEVEKMINEIGPTFKDRNGGYTRIIKAGRRFSDNAAVAILEWVEKIVKVEKPATTASNAASRSLAKAPVSAPADAKALAGKKALTGKQKKIAGKTSKRTSSSSKTKRKEAPSSRKATKGKASK